MSRFHDLLERIASYNKLEVAVELGLIWIVVYVVVRFVQGTRAAGALKGVLVVLIVATIISRVLGGGQSFERIAYLFDRFLALVAIGLIVIFQPELRRALIRLGEAPFFRGTPTELNYIVDQLGEACTYLSKAKFGGLVVIERQVPLVGLVEGGTKINAELSAQLLQTIFFPGAALHDLAVVVKGRVVRAAGVQLPLAEPADMPDPTLGSRHRAAVGLSKECDALVIVVSEENGRIRFAERGKLSNPLSADDFPDELRKRLERGVRQAKAAAAAAVGVAVAPDAIHIPNANNDSLAGVDAMSDSNTNALSETLNPLDSTSMMNSPTAESPEEPFEKTA